MRKSLTAFAFTVAIGTSSLLNAQTTQQNYPWRTSTGVQPVIHPDLQRSQARIILAEPDAPQAQATNSTRLELDAKQREAIRVAQLNMRGVHPGSKNAAQAPTRLEPSFANFSHTQEPALQDIQPSLSDNVQANNASPALQDTAPALAPQVIPTPVAPVAESIMSLPPSSTYAPADVPLSVESNASTDEPNYCGRDCKKDWCNLGCERNLFGTSPRGVEIGGWASIGYHNRNNIMLNNRSTEANLHQAWMYLEKAASQECPDWDVGYRIDMLYGVDGQDLQAFGNPPAGAAEGWDNSWDYGSYGWALPQAYVQFANDTWDVKLGKFFSPFGYEVIAAPDNFFYSHSYTMYYSEPFTMSGILAERRVTDSRSTILGATAGWDTAFESDTGGCLITGQRFKPNDRVDIALTTCFGDRGRRGIGALNTGVAQVQLTQDVKYVFQGDYLDFGTNQEFGIVQYLFKDLSPCAAVGARLEWWKSDQLFADTKSTYEFTMGANLRPNANITLRPEIRWDWGAAAIDPGTTIFGLDIVATY